MSTINIGGRLVGDGQPCYVVAEIGINHNGDVELACQLIDAAKDAGCDAVKFQKRTIELCYTPEELNKPRESPWGTTTREQKEGLELDQTDYEIIDRHCQRLGIQWFASCWDIPSVDFIQQFKPPCYKIASACLTNRELLEYTASMGKPILLSTGMSTDREIVLAMGIFDKRELPYVLMHATSTYPTKTEHLNLSIIKRMYEAREIGGVYPLIGYSGHEVGLATTLAAVAMGACVVERHITLDRSMYGSDQAASIEPHGFAHLVRDIREIEKAMGDGIKRVYPDELPIKAKLRKVETLL